MFLKALTVVSISSGSVLAQTSKPPEIKLLSPAECTEIVKRSDNEFYINGKVVIGGMTISQSNVPRNGISYGGVDPFDVINRSCFSGKRA